MQEIAFARYRDNVLSRLKSTTVYIQRIDPSGFTRMTFINNFTIYTLEMSYADVQTLLSTEKVYREGTTIEMQFDGLLIKISISAIIDITILKIRLNMKQFVWSLKEWKTRFSSKAYEENFQCTFMGCLFKGPKRLLYLCDGNAVLCSYPNKEFLIDKQQNKLLQSVDDYRITHLKDETNGTFASEYHNTKHNTIVTMKLPLDYIRNAL